METPIVTHEEISDAPAATAGEALAAQLDTALNMACQGLQGIADQVDRHLLQLLRLEEHRSLNGGW